MKRNPINEKILKVISKGFTIKSPSLVLRNIGDFSDYIIPTEDYSYITDVDITNNGLKKIPDFVFLFTQLRTLSISNNLIQELPEGLNKLNNLKYLYASNNQINTIADIRLSRNLEELDLSSNQITEIPEKFLDLPKLKDLILYNNKLTCLPKSIQCSTNLDRLFASNNKIQNLPQSIGKLDYLSYLDLSFNEIRFLPDSFGKLINLTGINLSKNLISSIPNSFSKLIYLYRINLSYNLLTELPMVFSKYRNLETLNLNNNRLTSFVKADLSHIPLKELYINNNELTMFPDSVLSINNLTILDLSYNKIILLPEIKHGELRSLTQLLLNNNELSSLPKSLVNIPLLSVLNIRNNKIEEYPSELSAFNKKAFTVDYSNNPFLDRAFQHTQRFSKIWQGDFHLREILKIYFAGFNSFYFKRTNNQIQFDVSNDPDGLAFAYTPEEETDLDQVNALLVEYFEILKEKIREGAATGSVYPQPSNDPANLFAQIQASNFALNATQVRVTAEKHIANNDVLISISQSLDSMQSEYTQQLHVNKKQALELQEHNVTHARLAERALAQGEELNERRQEALIRASIPIHISVEQKVILKQQIGNDFDRLRDLLHTYLTPYQKEEAEKLQQELDQVEHKPAMTPAEKQTLGKRLIRWMTGATSAMKTAKEAGQAGGELLEQLGKVKDFAEGVLSDPQLVDKIESIKQGLEGML